MTPFDFEFLRAFLRERSGLDLSPEKRYLVESRLLPVARRAGLTRVGELAQQIRAGSREIAADAIEAMMTNETFFFRDRTPFDQLRDVVVPALVKTRASRRSLRIWCAAASTGQEPYSIAMCLKDMEPALAGWRVEILATDLSNAVLDKARAGVFTQFEVQRGLPIGLLLRHFRQTGEQWQISPDLRAMVHFRQANLIEDFSRLGVFDVIFCRNALIYFDQGTKRGVYRRLAAAMEPDGVLVLGGAETTVGFTEAFKPCAAHRGLYRPNLDRRVSAFEHTGRVVPLVRAGASP